MISILAAAARVPAGSSRGGQFARGSGGGGTGSSPITRGGSVFPMGSKGSGTPAGNVGHKSGQPAQHSNIKVSKRPAKVVEDPGDGTGMRPGKLPAGVKDSPGGIRADIRKTLIGSGVDPTKSTSSAPIMADRGRGSYSVGSTKVNEGLKVAVTPVRSGHSVSVEFSGKSRGDVATADAALRARGYIIPGEHTPGRRVIYFNVRHNPG